MGVVIKMENKIGALRIWWNSNFGNKPYTRIVKDVEEAKLLIDVLSQYDLYLGDLINSNAFGLEIYVGEYVDYETNEGWEEYYNDDSQDISEIIDGCGY